MKFRFLFILLLSLNWGTIFSQSFEKQQQTNAVASQIILNNYTALSLEVGKKPVAFDLSNTYTYIQPVNDKLGNVYHILFQTDFFGKLNYIALSNNLNEIFNCEKKSLIGFYACIKNIGKSFISTEIIDAIINCILNRINYCAE